MKEEEKNWGLSGYAKKSSVELEFLEPLNSNLNYVLKVSLNGVELMLHISGEEKVKEIKDYFSDSLNNPDYDDKRTPIGHWEYAKNPYVLVGSVGAQEFRLVRDGKYRDRYFVSFCDEGSSGVVRFTLGGKILNDTIQAINELWENINNGSA